jgi:hypothetical protein
MGTVEALMGLRADSLLVGALETADREGVCSTDVIVDGTPAGFRALAGVLLRMADAVESGKTEGLGWGLVLSPEDITGLGTLDVKALSLGCKPEGGKIQPES